MDNGTFVDNMLVRMQDRFGDDLQYVLTSIRDHYNQDDDLLLGWDQVTYDSIDFEIKRINLRVKDMLDVIDPMWYVVALYHRNKGGLWRDMHKYGVKKEYASSYKVETASADPTPVHTQEQQN